MSRTSDAVSATASVPDQARPLRAAAIGSLIAAIAYVLIPVSRGVISALLSADATSVYPTPAEIGSQQWTGLVFFVLYGAVGAGTLLLTQGTVAAVTARAGDSFAARVARSAGVIAAAGFLLFGGGARSMWSFIGANMAETGAEPSAQVAAIWAINVSIAAPIFAAVTAFAVWSCWLAVAVRRTGVLPRALAAVVAVLAVIVAAALVVAVFLPAQFLYVALFAVCAIGLRSAARRVRGAEHAQAVTTL